MIITLYKFTIDTDIDIYTDNLWTRQLGEIGMDRTRNTRSE